MSLKLHVLLFLVVLAIVSRSVLTASTTDSINNPPQSSEAKYTGTDGADSTTLKLEPNTGTTETGSQNAGTRLTLHGTAVFVSAGAILAFRRLLF
jgi:hypothetical protein